ncbi:hypothetical protein HYN46_13890 [Aquirhabdus parva]|uniref:Uncharacterized protein n=1 Tax=Aquirhabdus parva TaxID=2283318 RepID=A0A345P969_9GAMM|nr:hypothetical protein HYN46_13890 [Aquirhabdus parva]
MNFRYYFRCIILAPVIAYFLQLAFHKTGSLTSFILSWVLFAVVLFLAMYAFAHHDKIEKN